MIKLLLTVDTLDKASVAVTSISYSLFSVKLNICEYSPVPSTDGLYALPSIDICTLIAGSSTFPCMIIDEIGDDVS